MMATRREPEPREHPGERLNKVLARSGLTSRRGADRLIAEGRVTVNGRVVHELGVRVDPEQDAIKVDGRRIAAAPRRHSYWMLNKPTGVVTSLSDPEGRPTVRDLLGRVHSRVFPVGRLDYHTEGLLLLTDDGPLARDLMHPGSHVAKVYRAKVRGRPSREMLAKLARGVRLEGRRTLPARFAIVRPGPNSWIEIEIVEGRKRQIRRMLQAVGHPVQRLRRTGYAGLDLRGLPVGELRALTPAEVEKLRRAVARGRRDSS